MSRFLSDRYSRLVPYVPGEQPRDGRYVKLNTNESPFPPSEKALSYAAEHARRYNLYSDPDCTELKAALADTYGLSPENICVGNGSDEILNFAFMAFCDDSCPAVYADITYGFYKVFAAVNNVPGTVIPLRDDFTIDVEAFKKAKGTKFIANPNAPTGIALPASVIEEILKACPDDVVVVDEAYVDFGAESCLPLMEKYENLLVVMTFSKSRSMAGARLGFATGCRELITDLETIRNSINPYNVNSYTIALGTGTLLDAEYTKKCCADIMENRIYCEGRLREMGFEMTDSFANFIFVRHPKVPGEEIYLKLKEKGVLVRHFTQERIKDWNRITIGSRDQLDRLAEALSEIIR
ncbi:MAG: histidinol-phosphate transaminase [Firmicutes bacterium]|nr:histidinol-phosphate transaminase [Bacillota bacterium]